MKYSTFDPWRTIHLSVFEIAQVIEDIANQPQCVDDGPNPQIVAAPLISKKTGFYAGIQLMLTVD